MYRADQILFSDRPICLSKPFITNPTVRKKQDRPVANQNGPSIHHLPDPSHRTEPTEPHFKVQLSSNRNVARLQDARLQLPPFFTHILTNASAELLNIAFLKHLSASRSEI